MRLIEYNLVNTVPRLAEIKRTADTIEMTNLKQRQKLAKEIGSVIRNLNLGVETKLEKKLIALKVKIQCREITRENLIHKLNKYQTLAICLKKSLANVSALMNDLRLQYITLRTLTDQASRLFTSMFIFMEPLVPPLSAYKITYPKKSESNYSFLISKTETIDKEYDLTRQRTGDFAYHPKTVSKIPEIEEVD